MDPEYQLLRDLLPDKALFFSTFSSTMKAVGMAKPGGLDVIADLELPMPVCQPSQLLIKVEYGGVNAIDLLYREGVQVNHMRGFPQLPAALGTECSGVIVALPEDGDTLSDAGFQKRMLRVGSRVVAMTAGAFAEYIVAPWQCVFSLPDEISARDGAAALVHGITALTFTREVYNVNPGEYVLVHTVAGGVGMLMAQLIKARGGIVIGTTSTSEKAAIAKAHGADHVILYKTEDTVARVLEITGGKGVHVVYDGVGKDTFENNFKIIRLNATVVMMGLASGLVDSFPPSLLRGKNAKFAFASAGNYLREPELGPEYVAELFRLIAEGSLKVVPQKSYPFTAEGVREAQRALINRSSIGKLVVKVA